MNTPVRTSTAGLLGSHKVVLAILLLIGLAVRVWFADGRWINPDEGAHLMDGLLVLNGHVPGVDFGARQPFYVYVLAGFLAVGGVSYEAARSYPILATVAIGGLVYLIAARLYDRRVGLLAAAIYLFLPFTVVYGTHVKTEPLTILLACLAVHTLLLALERNENLLLLALSGALLALGYYSRQSSLGVLLALGVIVAFALPRPRPLTRAGAGLAGGFLVVCGLVIGAYATVVPLGQVMTCSLNPVAFVVGQGSGWRGATEQSSDSDDQAETAVAGQPEDQSWSTTVRNLRRTVNLNSVLIVALALSPFHLFLTRGREDRRRKRWGAVVVYAWIGGVGLAYAYWVVRRGFFPAYFGELIPPLAILTAAVAVDGVSRLRPAGHPGWRDVLVFGLIGLGFLALHALLSPGAIHRPLYFVAVPAILGIFFLPGERRRQLLAVIAIVATAVGVIVAAGHLGPVARYALYGLLLVLVFVLLLIAARLDPRRDPGRAGAFASYSLLAASAMMWLGVSQAEIDRRFDGVWSPGTVSDVADHLDEILVPDDRVMSGGVIWEFEARREPFLLISHPLSLRANTNPARRAEIERGLLERLPAAIVLDGYTEMTYLDISPSIEPLLETRYGPGREFTGSRYPVRVYALAAIDGARSAGATSSP